MQEGPGEALRILAREVRGVLLPARQAPAPARTGYLDRPDAPALGGLPCPVVGRLLTLSGGGPPGTGCRLNKKARISPGREPDHTVSGVGAMD